MRASTAGGNSYTAIMQCRSSGVMFARRLTGAGLGSLIAVVVATGFAGGVFAGETVWRGDADSGSKPARRLAFNASGHHLPSDSRRPADPSAGAEVDILRQAAEAGDAHAQLNLGLCYENGRGVSRDAVQAIKWLRRAAEQGFDEAQYELGCCYNGDDGFPKDPGEAAKWWEKAAAQGYADAQYCLGLSYSSGEGVARNPAAAAKWWQHAAVQGHAGAQYFLGLSYSLGLGVPKIPELAIHWLGKAATNGNEKALAALKKLGAS